MSNDEVQVELGEVVTNSSRPRVRIINAGNKPAVYRDDAGKHRLKPRETAEVGGAYLPAVLAVPGLQLASTGKPKKVEEE